MLQHRERGGRCDWTASLRATLCLAFAAALAPGAAPGQEAAPPAAQEPADATPPAAAPPAAEPAAAQPAAARPPMTEPAPPDLAAAQAAAADLLTPDQLDALAAPVALYSDALLAQLLVAATYPLEVMKADRFLAAHKETAAKDRADLIAAEDWDESVRSLAAGFPDVVARMAEQIDWTEDLGDAMLAQPDDLLDAVQRLRAQAQAVGNLETNAAQTVSQEGDQIEIAPASPDVVYVPSYDPAMAFVAPTTQPVVVYDDPGVSFGDLAVTGAIAFGSAMLVNEIFDDDDWDDYWHGHGSIDWDEDALYPRRDIDVDGDVNIDRDVTIDRDRTRIGDRDGDQLRRAQEWRADPAQREAARDRIAARTEGAPGARPANVRPAEARPPGDRPLPRDAAERAKARGAAEAGLKARSGGPTPAAIQSKLENRPAAADRPKAKAAKASALKPGGQGVARAKDRGGASLKKAPARPPKAIAKSQKLEKRAPPRKASAHSSALKKPKVSPTRSRASIQRGGRHRR